MIRTFEPREDGSCCQHQQYITSRAHSCQCAKDSILAPAPECLQAVAARGHLPMGLECPTTHPQPALHSYHKLLTKLAHMYTYQCVHIVHSGIVHIWLQRHFYGASIKSSHRWENTYKIIKQQSCGHWKGQQSCLGWNLQFGQAQIWCGECLHNGCWKRMTDQLSHPTSVCSQADHPSPFVKHENCNFKVISLITLQLPYHYTKHSYPVSHL